MKTYELFKKQQDTITLTGSSGTATVTIGVNTYVATFNSTLATTASDFITAEAANILAADALVLTNPSGADLVFRSVSGEGFVMSIANTTGNLDGTQVADQEAVKAEIDTDGIATGGNVTIHQIRNLAQAPLSNPADFSANNSEDDVANFAVNVEVLQKLVKNEVDLITYAVDNDLSLTRKEMDGSSPSVLRAEA